MKLVIIGHFLPFSTYTPKNLKNQDFEKIKKKKCWRYHHFTHVYQKPQSYEAWFLRYRVRKTEIFVILGHFLHFYPTKNPEN